MGLCESECHGYTSLFMHAMLKYLVKSSALFFQKIFTDTLQGRFACFEPPPTPPTPTHWKFQFHFILSFKMFDLRDLPLLSNFQQPYMVMVRIFFGRLQCINQLKSAKSKLWFNSCGQTCGHWNF